MRTRWPFKQTMQIRWSAVAWRPTITFGSAQAGRPAAVRLLRPAVTTENQNQNGVENGAIWI